MTVRKSAEVNFRKAQKPQKTAILALRKSAEVCGSRILKPAENRAEVCGSGAEVRPPLRGLLPHRPLRGLGAGTAHA
jgi:hypothetical protein